MSALIIATETSDAAKVLLDRLDELEVTLHWLVEVPGRSWTSYRCDDVLIQGRGITDDGRLTLVVVPLDEEGLVKRKPYEVPFDRITQIEIT